MVRVSRQDALALVLSLVLSIMLPIAVGAVGAVYNAASRDYTWYAAIEKPAWIPPSWLIGPVWTFLYITMGFSVWLVWRADRGQTVAGEHRVRTAFLVYAAQLGANAAWAPIFFGAKRIDIALAVIAVLLALIVATIRRFYQVNRLAGLLLVPYLAWVTFATVLNATIWQLNR